MAGEVEPGLHEVFPSREVVPARVARVAVTHRADGSMHTHVVLVPLIGEYTVAATLTFINPKARRETLERARRFQKRGQKLRGRARRRRTRVVRG